MKETFESIIDYIKKGAEATGGDLKPDEDWRPICFLFGGKMPDGQENGLSLMPLEMRNDREKEIICANVIPAIIGKVNPDFAMILTTAWMKSYNGPDADSERARDDAIAGSPGKIEGRPGVKEILSIMIAARNGDTRMLTAEIIRSDAAPVLKWADEVFENGLEGRFADAMRDGFKQAHKVKPELGSKFMSSFLGNYSKKTSNGKLTTKITTRKKKKQA